jgi:TIR domain-containing protein
MPWGGSVWDEDKFRLFISHTSEHKQDVASLKRGLATFGIDAFVAHDDIEPSREWQVDIEDALATCDAIAAWLTPDFPESRWTDQEVGFCVGRTIQVIPVQMGINPYGFISRYQALPGAGRGPLDISQAIAEAVAGNPASGRAYVEGAVRAFEVAGSFEMARVGFRILTLLPRDGWSHETLDRLADAPSKNSQIEHCVYESQPLPQLLPQFIAERRLLAQARRSISPSGARLIECRGAVEKVDWRYQPNDRDFSNNWTVWLTVKNNGPTAEFSVRFWNVRGLPPQWGADYAVREVSWEGAAGSTRPEIDGYGGERRVFVANVSFGPLAFWFFMTRNGQAEFGPQFLLSELFPEFYGHNIMFDVETVNQSNGEKLLKTGSIFIPPEGTPRFELREIP